MYFSPLLVVQIPWSVGLLPLDNSFFWPTFSTSFFFEATAADDDWVVRSMADGRGGKVLGVEGSWLNLSCDVVLHWWSMLVLWQHIWNSATQTNSSTSMSSYSYGLCGATCITCHGLASHMKFKHPSWSTLANKNGHKIDQHPTLNSSNTYRHHVELRDNLEILLQQFVLISMGFLWPLACHHLNSQQMQPPQIPGTPFLTASHLSLLTIIFQRFKALKVR